MLLLVQDGIRKRLVKKATFQPEFEDGDSKEYKVKAIWNSAVYAKD